MDFMTFDMAIVVTFLLVNLGVGLYYGRGVTNIRQYALGGQNFRTSSLVSTIVATGVTGSMFTVVMSRTYTDGLYGMIPICGFALSFLILSRYFIPRMSSFFGDLSIADSMGRYYGKQAQIITAVCAMIVTIGVVAIQYKVFGSVLSYFLGVDLTYTVILSGLVVTIYSAFGGIRSVTFTDVLQFMLFGSVIPFVGVVLWKTVICTEGVTLTPLLSTKHFNLFDILDFRKYEFWDMLLLLGYATIPSSSASFQRIIMGKDVAQAKEAFSISAILILGIIVAVAWIGFLLFALEPKIGADKLLPYLIDNYSYVGFKGLIVASVIAMSLSSSDSFINMASVFGAHDICKPLGLKSENELKVARFFAIFIGIGSIYLALSGSGLLQIVLFANAFYMPIVIPPLLSTIWGFDTSKYTVLTGMVAGFATVILWKIIGVPLDPIIPAMLINFLVMLLIHYIGAQGKGWVKRELQ